MERVTKLLANEACKGRLLAAGVQIRGFACDCAFPQHCDSQAGELPPTRLLQSELEDELRREQGSEQPESRQGHGSVATVNIAEHSGAEREESKPPAENGRAYSSGLR